MSQQHEPSIPWSKLGQREVSHFMGQEMIYDYITHGLDPERRAAVEKFIFDTKDAQNDMIRMLNGIQYVELLSETLVSEPVINRINEPSSYLAVLLKKTNFQRWPTSVKWALEALIVVCCIMVTSIFIPWDKMSKLNPFPERNEMVLAEVDRLYQVGDPNKLKEIEMNQPAEFADDDIAETIHTETTKVEKPTTASKTTAGAPAKEEKKPIPEPTQAPTVVAAAAKPSESTAPPTTKNEALEAKEEHKETEKKPIEGSLFRGGIAVTNLEMVGPKIKEKIMELGGRKAGQVELGWKRPDNSSYFHFTLPEAKMEELNQFLANYGELKIAKEKHPRVMPDGIIRLIIVVNEASP